MILSTWQFRLWEYLTFAVASVLNVSNIGIYAITVLHRFSYIDCGVCAAIVVND